MEDRFQVPRAQVQAEEALHIGAHLLEAGGTAQFTKVQAQVGERSDNGHADARDQQQVDQAIHVSLQRSKRLS